MADKYDPYREALVMETLTVWPDELSAQAGGAQRDLETKLHAEPAACVKLEYIRMHTGFCRKIVVTPDDLKRLQG